MARVIKSGLQPAMRQRPGPAKNVLARAVLASLTAHIAVLDRTGRIVAANAAWSRFVRRDSAAEPRRWRVGANYLAACQAAAERGDDWAKRAMEGVQAVLDGAILSFNMEYPFRGPDADRWFALSATPLEPEHGGAVVWHTDITARKQAEIAWQTSEERLRTIVAHTPVLLWAVDGAGIFTLLEGPSLVRTGTFARARVGASIWDVVRPLPTLAAEVRRAFAGENVLSVFETNGREYELRYSLVHDAAGAVSGLIGVGVDVTERQQALRDAELARHAAMELAQVRSDFVGAVSHELRTPLTAILGYGELLRAHWCELDEGQRLTWLDRIIVSANRQQHLVEDLLTLTRVESGVLAPICADMLVRPCVERAALEVQGAYAGQPIQLYGAGQVCAYADAARVLQILVHLLDNASKYSPEGSPVIVSWRVEEGHVAIRVRDAGTGIPESGRAVLFTRFGRVAGSRIRAGHVGTGLGLFLGREFARGMGGELALEASGPTGSTFVLTLPLAACPVSGAAHLPPR